MVWEEKLLGWNIPKNLVYPLSSSLETIGLRQEDFTSPFQLGKFLHDYQKEYPEVVTYAWWDPIRDFFTWLWNVIKPYLGYLGLGALIIIIVYLGFRTHSISLPSIKRGG
ncbi:MAG: hypothetical protein ACTSSP_07525 [Candidatus Asgardarchaeia archaeon]